MSSLSTHVLDTSLGLPVAALAVLLELELDGRWQALSSHTTDGDGRVKQMAASLDPGNYRLTFVTATYFQAKGIAGLYPLVQINFLVRDPAAHYHIPLLLSANGYSTYRGS